MDEPLEGEVPAVMPIEHEGVAPVEGERPRPEEVLGLPYDHPSVRTFIGDSKVTKEVHDDRTYVTASARGLILRIEDGVIEKVVLAVLGKGLEREYDDPMPGGIQFGERPEQVHRRLGKPDLEEPERGSDTWHRATWSLNVRYEGTDGGIFLVTLMKR